MKIEPLSDNAQAAFKKVKDVLYSLKKESLNSHIDFQDVIADVLELVQKCEREYLPRSTVFNSTKEKSIIVFEHIFFPRPGKKWVTVESNGAFSVLTHLEPDILEKIEECDGQWSVGFDYDHDPDSLTVTFMYKHQMVNFARWWLKNYGH